MKSLREYIIVAGKDLKEELNHKFLLNHKLNKQIQNKKSNIKFASSNAKLNFDYPVLKKLNNNEKYEYELIGNKTLKIPKAKFFVFKDNYRNKLHICSIEDMIGFGNEYFDKEIVFTKRAKKVLELAWELAKKDKKNKIESEHLLLAITQVPDSSAMKALEQLGVDAVEIKEGIKKLQEA